jgi:hypothetical protein
MKKDSITAVASMKSAGIHTCDETKKSIFETHDPIFEVCFSCDEIHFTCDGIKKRKNENRFSCDETRHGRDRKNHRCGFFINSSGNKQH